MLVRGPTLTVQPWHGTTADTIALRVTRDAHHNAPLVSSHYTTHAATHGPNWGISHEATRFTSKVQKDTSIYSHEHVLLQH
jgi:hypothetical protein